MVRGFPWCLDEPKSIGLASLVAKILCQKHNNELSELDATAFDAFDAFRQAMQLSGIRTGLKAKSWTVKRMEINGPRLERWFLKTLINLSFRGKWIIGPGDHSEGIPSKDLVEIAFGLRQFEPGAGLYISGKAGEQINSMDRVNLIPRSKGRNLVAGEFSFRGFKFYLNLLPQRFDMDGQSHLLYRYAKLKFQVPDRKGRLVLSHEIKFIF